MERNTVNHSAHSTWRCQYHIVFAPKFRRKVIYGQLKADIGYILRKAMRREKGGNYRSRSVSRPRSYARNSNFAHGFSSF